MEKYIFKTNQTFLKNNLDKPNIFLYNIRVHRGIAQLVEYWSPKPRVVGSSPSAPAKKSKSKDLDFFICVRRTQHHLRATHATSFERQLNIIAAPRHK